MGSSFLNQVRHNDQSEWSVRRTILFCMGGGGGEKKQSDGDPFDNMGPTPADLRY